MMHDHIPLLTSAKLPQPSPTLTPFSITKKSKKKQQLVNTLKNHVGHSQIIVFYNEKRNLLQTSSLLTKAQLNSPTLKQNLPLPIPISGIIILKIIKSPIPSRNLRCLTRRSRSSTIGGGSDGRRPVGLRHRCRNNGCHARFIQP